MTNATVPTAPALTLRRRYPVSRERLFQAWTDPAIAARFLGPGDHVAEVVEMDVRPGGRYRIVMRAPDGEAMTVGGVYRDVRAPERLSMTWQWDEDDPADLHESLVTLEFVPREGGTELVLTHEALASEASRDRHEHGWTMVVDQLGGLLLPKVAIDGIDLSGFMVKDTQRAMAFYRDVLGLEPALVYPENRGAEYELPDGSTFGLWGGGAQSAMPFQPSNGVLFAVRDFDAALAAVKAHGIPIAMLLDLPTCRMAAVPDPEGNTVMLHERKAR